MFDDEDIITFLYSNSNLEEDHPYFSTIGVTAIL